MKWLIIGLNISKNTNMVTIPVSIGELIDKLSILQVKKNKITDENKLSYINKEFELLYNLSFVYLDSPQIMDCYHNLVSTNTKLWDLEDTIRRLEDESDFNSPFIECARKIYKTNDERFKIKDVINKITDSEIQEQKSYQNKSENSTSNFEDKWIYESPDGGKTIFRRPFGSSHDKREKVTNE